MTSGTGTCSVIANQAGNGNYSAAPQVTQTVSATPASQTITFTYVPSSVAYNSQFTVTATSGASPVVFTNDGSGVCSNSGATYTMTSGTGTCSVIANQAGDSNYLAAPQATASVTATLAKQIITFTTNAPASAVYNSNFTVAATGGASGNAVTFTSAGSCSNSGATYTMTSGTGTCSVIANQAGNSNYLAAPTVTQTVSAAPAPQAITFSISAPATAAYNSNFTVAATGGASGNPVTFTSAGSCINTGATYTMTNGTGTCSVIANQAGNGNYAAATPVTQSVTATPATQSITFTTNAPASAVYNSNFTVAATGGASGNAVTFTSGGSCGNVGATYTMTSGTGTCTVIANQAGNSNYAAAPQVTQSVTATKATQSIAVSQAAPATAADNSSFTVAASASSGLAVSFGSSGACINVLGTYTMDSTKVGAACTVTMSQGGNGNYAAASNVTETTTVAKPIPPTVSFTGAPASAYYLSTFTVAATTNASTSPVITATGACTINPTTLIVTMSSGTGKCNLTAAWAADNVYVAASLKQTTTAAKIAPTVTLTGAPASAPYQSTYQLAATTNASTTPVITAAPASVCTISGTTVTMASGTGTCKVTAKWAADSNYLAAAGTQSTTASLLASTISWTAPAAITYGTPLSATQLDATANVAGSFSYSPKAGTILAAGTQTLSVTFKPTPSKNYAGANASVELTVNAADTTTTISKATAPKATPLVVAVTFAVASQTVGSKAQPTGSVTVTDSASATTCTGTLASGKGSCILNFVSSEKASLTATYSGDANDNASASTPAFAVTVQ